MEREYPSWGTHVVLGGNGAVEVGVQEGDLLEDVPTNTGNLAEHEEGSGTGEDTEATGESSADRQSVHADMMGLDSWLSKERGRLTSGWRWKE